MGCHLTYSPSKPCLAACYFQVEVIFCKLECQRLQVIGYLSSRWLQQWWSLSSHVGSYVGRELHVQALALLLWPSSFCLLLVLSFAGCSLIDGTAFYGRARHSIVQKNRNQIIFYWFFLLKGRKIFSRKLKVDDKPQLSYAEILLCHHLFRQ